MTCLFVSFVVRVLVILVCLFFYSFDLFVWFLFALLVLPLLCFFCLSGVCVGGMVCSGISAADRLRQQAIHVSPEEVFGCSAQAGPEPGRVPPREMFRRLLPGRFDRHQEVRVGIFCGTGAHDY